MTTREIIIETINKLFIYTDDQEWELLQSEVFTKDVFLDMTSMGGEAKDITSKAICQMWSEGFKELDSVNHLGANYLVNVISETEAYAFAYATATHYKESAKKGKTREFIGKYNFKFRKTSLGWRIFSFIYHLKFINGNVDLS